MHRPAHHSAHPPARAPRPAAGQSLLDALVALLLVATTLLGAATALVRGIAASRGAALQTSAVDLVADLSEQLRASDPTGQSSLVENWTRSAADVLPSGTAQAVPMPEAATGPEAAGQWSRLTLRWHDPADAQPFVMQLPLLSAPDREGG